MGVLTTKVFYKRIPQLFTCLRDDWTNDRVDEHAETSAVALAHLALNPRYAATVVLPAVVDFVDRKGPQGVDGILLTALSAACVYDPKVFHQAVNRIDLLSQDIEIPEPKEGFAIPFLDLTMVREVGLLAGAVGKAKARHASPYGEVMNQILGSILNPSPLGGNEPRSLMARYGSTGARIIGKIIGSLSKDSARQRMFRGHFISRPASTTLVPGFGITIRNGTSGSDEYRLPASRSGGYGKGFWNTVNQCMRVQAVTAAVGGVGAAAAKTGAAGGVIVGAGYFYGCLAAGISWLWEETERLEASTEAMAREMYEREQARCRASGGRCDPPDPQDEVKMPLPDGIGGEAPSIYDILEAAERYGGRDDPYIYPVQEDLGGGVVMVHMPNPGNIDPLWEDVPVWMDEDTLKAWLQFLQAKYFDSLVNPVRD